MINLLFPTGGNGLVKEVTTGLLRNTL